MRDKKTINQTTFKTDSTAAPEVDTPTDTVSGAVVEVTDNIQETYEVNPRGKKRESRNDEGKFDL